ncbi:MAG TPA: disulfide bond formation protein B, partial [Candidatus Paceibacterota bacterium]
PAGVVLGQLGIAIFLLALIFDRNGWLVQFVGKHAIWLATLFLLAAVGGSLFYSNIIGFEPCYLCWWQRIFIYPQLILFLVALKNKTRDVFKYSLPLSIIGALIAVYQILLPYLAQAGIDCGSSGLACTKLYVLAFGYVTIPVMSLTAFAILILLAISNKLTKSDAKE